MLLNNAGTANGEFNKPTLHFQFLIASDGITCERRLLDGKLPMIWIILELHCNTVKEHRYHVIYSGKGGNNFILKQT
jgi:hypothetical protein